MKSVPETTAIQKERESKIDSMVRDIIYEVNLTSIKTPDKGHDPDKDGGKDDDMDWSMSSEINDQ